MLPAAAPLLLPSQERSIPSSWLLPMRPPGGIAPVAWTWISAWLSSQRIGHSLPRAIVVIHLPQRDADIGKALDRLVQLARAVEIALGQAQIALFVGLADLACFRAWFNSAVARNRYPSASSSASRGPGANPKRWASCNSAIALPMFFSA